MKRIKKSIKLTLLLSLFGHGTHAHNDKHIEVRKPGGRRQDIHVVAYK